MNYIITPQNGDSTLWTPDPMLETIAASSAPSNRRSRPTLIMRSIAQSLSTNPSWAEIHESRRDINRIPASTVRIIIQQLTDVQPKMSMSRLNMEIGKMLLCAVSYRIRMPVTEMLEYADNAGYYVCPRCKTTMQREFQRYCDRCGQALDWSGNKKVKVVRR